MKPKALTWLIVLVLLFTTGCAGSGGSSNPVIPGSGEQDAEIQLVNPVENRNSGHLLLSYNMIHIDATDPDALNVEMVPVRVGALHLNILKLLEEDLCNNCVSITDYELLEPGVLRVHIEITHPLEDPFYTLFDVRGIVMFNGSHLYPASGLRTSNRTLGDGELINADGFTTLYNPSTLGQAGDLFTYYKGNLSTEQLPNSNLNGFLRYLWPLTMPGMKAGFPAGYVLSTDYVIQMPSNDFRLGFAVDASWEETEGPYGQWPWSDWPISIACEEPYRIGITEVQIGPGLIIGGGETGLEIDVYDIQGTETHKLPIVECPELFNGTVEAFPIDDYGFYTTFGAHIKNSLGAPEGTYRCLISVEDYANDNSPYYLDLTAYQIYEIRVRDPADIVNFPDEVLKAGIRDEINKFSGDIYLEDILGMTHLGVSPNAGDPQVQNLEGIQYCYNLVHLNLAWNEISDISLLQNLTSLSSLYLGKNKISDVSALQNLTSMHNLSLYKNQISDIFSLQNMNEMELLLLSENQIDDISQLQNMAALELLYLDDNLIDDITPLQNLTELPKLDLSNNQVSDLTPIQSMIGLTELDLSINQVADLTPLQNLTKLEYLYLSNNLISDTTPIQNLGEIKTLYLSQNQISDLASIPKNSLTILVISENQVSDLTPLQDMELLSAFNADSNLINDLSPIQYTQSLGFLSFRDNQISDLYPLVLCMENGGLEPGTYVYLHNNPLDETSINVYIPELEANGVYVYW